MRLELIDGSEVVDIHRPKQPATPTQTRHVSCRLKQATQLAGGGRIFGAAVKRLDGASAIHQCAVSTARRGDTNIRQVGGIAGVLFQVRDYIVVTDLDVSEEILHRRKSLAPTRLKPVLLVGRQFRGTAHRRATGWAADGGRSVSIGGIGEGTMSEVVCVRGSSGDTCKYTGISIFRSCPQGSMQCDRDRVTHRVARPGQWSPTGQRRSIS